MNRQFTNKNEAEFTVIQFNTLADHLAHSFPHCEKLNWEHRKILLLNEIEKYDADIICLQEVDHFEDFFEPEFKKRNYSGLFKQKTNGKDGCALFYSNKLTLIRSQLTELSGNQIAIFSELSTPYLTFVVATTHLKAKPEFEELRQQQAIILLSKLKEFNVNNNDEIICLDMNSEPQSITHNVFTEQNYWTEKTNFTTFKIREKEVCRTIDYIFYTTIGWDHVSSLEIPSKEEIGANGLPNEFYPSDHLLLCNKFNYIY